MRVKLSKKVAKTLEALENKTQERLWEAIKKIPDGDIRRLMGNNSVYRLRVGGWRILFSYPEQDTILIEKISPRGDAYKGV